MPPKRKAENRPLPARWVFKHGAFYYLPPKDVRHLWDNKAWFRLGVTLPEAHKIWAERAERPKQLKTIGELLDRYLLEVVPAKAPKTATDNVKQVANLRKTFGEMHVEDMEPQFVYQYYDKRTKKTAAKREIEVLSHLFTKAVEWGVLKKHPFRGEVRLPDAPPRDRYVEDWEVVEILSMAPRRKKGSVLMVQAYVRVKLLTSMARSDLLRIEPARHFQEDGIHIQRHKTKNSTGKRTIYNWTPELREAVAMAIAARPVDISPFLFCKQDGTGYFNEATGEAKAWDHLWDGFMDRALKETELKSRFTEHDLRAKVASDADSEEHARALLSHVDARLTRRVYRRKPERVTPAKVRF